MLMGLLLALITASPFVTPAEGASRLLWAARAPGETAQTGYGRAIFLVETDSGFELLLYNSLGAAPLRAGFQKTINNTRKAAVLFARGRRPFYNAAPIPGMDHTLLVTAPGVPDFVHVYSFNGDPLGRDGSAVPTHVMMTPDPALAFYGDELAGNEIPSPLITGQAAEHMLELFDISGCLTALAK